MIDKFKIGLTALISGIGWLLGGFDKMILVLIPFMIIDYLTGVLCAFKNKKLSSEIGFWGILKKGIMLLVVATANLTGLILNTNSLRYIVISFYLANEGISILENATKMNIPIPKPLKNALKQIKENEGDE